MAEKNKIDSILENHKADNDALKTEVELLKDKYAQKLLLEKLDDKELKILNQRKSILDQIEKKENEILKLNPQDTNYENDRKKILQERLKLTHQLEDFDRKHKDSLDGILRKEREVNETVERRTLTLDKIKNSYNSILSVGKDLAKTWRETDAVTSTYVRTIGGSQRAMDNMRKSMLEFVNSQKIASKYNVSAKELVEIQTKYNSELGRAVALTNEQRETAAGLFKVFGENGGKMASALDVMGVNYGRAGDIAGKLFSDASKKGIAVSKVSDLFLSNIKKAQDYTFKNGIEGLRQMAEKSAAIRMDMNAISSFANKVSTVEGALTTSASLSVLGGQFGAFSNPMAMLNESLTDMQGLSDRMEKMFSGFARWDSKKGQIDIGAYDRQRIKVAAEAMGVDASAIFEQVLTTGRRNMILGQLKGQNYGKEETELISNIAQLDKNGNAFVNINGQEKYISGKDKNKLTNADIEYLKQLNKSDGEKITDIAFNTRSFNDKLEGLNKQVENMKATIVEKSGLMSLLGGVLSSLGQISAAVAILAFAGPLGRSVNALSGGRIGQQLGQNVNNTLGRWSLGGGGTNVARRGSTYTSSRGITYTKGRNGQWIGTSKNGSTIKLSGNGLKMAESQGAAKAGSGFFRGAAGATRIASGIAGGVISGGLTALNEFGGDNNHSTGRKITTTALSTLLGSAGLIGSFIPFIGPIVGATVSMVGPMAVTGISKLIDKKRKQKKQELGLSNLEGDYRVGELGKIKDGTWKYDENLIKKLGKNGDLDKIDNQNIGTQSVNDLYVNNVHNGNGFSEGGVVHGKGSETSDSNFAFLSKNEAVLTASTVRRLGGESTIKALNSGDITSIRPLGNQMEVKTSANRYGGNGNMNLHMNDFNIGGTINLNLNGNTTQLNTNELLNNPQFKNEITKMVAKEIMNQNNYGYDKKNFYGRWS